MYKKKEGRDLTSTEDCVDVAIQGIRDYIKKSNERLITAASNKISNIGTIRKTAKIRKQKWEEKQQYGYFKRPNGATAFEKT